MPRINNAVLWLRELASVTQPNVTTLGIVQRLLAVELSVQNTTSFQALGRTVSILVCRPHSRMGGGYSIIGASKWLMTGNKHFGREGFLRAQATW